MGVFFFLMKFDALLQQNVVISFCVSYESENSGRGSSSLFRNFKMLPFFNETKSAEHHQSIELLLLKKTPQGAFKEVLFP